MKKRLLLCLLTGFVFLNPLFLDAVWGNSDTYFWIGGYSDKWEDKENWRNLDQGVNGQLPAPDGDVMIDGETVIVNISSSVTTGSIQLSGGATLVIKTSGILTTREGGLIGSHGIRLDEITPYEYSGNPGDPDYSFYLDGSQSGASALIVEGTLNINVSIAVNYRAPKSGMYINSSTSVTVIADAVVNINVAKTNGIEIAGDLSNSGNITISNPNDNGIKFRGGGAIVNESSGTLTISGGGVSTAAGDGNCIVFRSNTSFINYGKVVLSGAYAKLIDGDEGWSFENSGEFQGAGTVNAKYFTHSSGSTLIPGMSPGCLTFENVNNTVNLSNVTFEIEIEGITPCSQYDRIVFNGTGTVNLSNSALSLSGDYTPVSGNSFNFVTGTSTLNGNPGGSPFLFNQVELVLVPSSSGTLLFSQAFPVELTSFTARPLGKAAELQWATATETNNDYFSIEHSTDGRQFTEVGRVSGFGTTQKEHRYTFMHHSPAAGLNYYRLNQHDFDGGHEYSKIQTVVFEEESSWTVRPTLAHEFVTVEWVSAPGGDSIIEAFNLSGQKVYAHKAPAQSAKLRIPVESWQPGMYWVQVRSGGAATTRRFVKE